MSTQQPTISETVKATLAGSKKAALRGLDDEARENLARVLTRIASGQDLSATDTAVIARLDAAVRRAAQIVLAEAARSWTARIIGIASRMLT